LNNVLNPPEITDVNGKIVFLAGPIHSARNWQNDAIKLIHDHDSSIIIANPRRGYFIERFDFSKQADWEMHYQNKAAKNGTILFWLAKEETHKCDRPYAQNTRFVLGEWMVRHLWQNVNIVVGIEDGFSGSRFLYQTINQKCNKINIKNTLEGLCKELFKTL